MGIFNNITKIFKRNYNPENPQNPIIPPLNYGETTSSGVNVNESNALTLSAVWGCIRTLSESVSSLPVNVYKRDITTGSRDIAYAHSLYNLLHNAPSINMTSYCWFNTMMLNLCLYGNAYACIKRDNRMRPVDLVILDPSTIQITIVEGKKFYIQDTSGKKYTYSDEEIIHIMGLSTNGYIGKSPISAARENIGLGIATQNYGGAFFGNGASLSGVLEHPGTLSKEAMERLAYTWNKKYANNGGSNAHKTAILEEGMAFKNISIPPNDAQFIETRKFSVIEICRIFRVPPHLVMSLDAATYSNIEQQSLEFVKYTLYPYLRNWEQELNRKLFKENEKSKLYVEFKLDGLLRGDTKSRSDFYRTLWNMGVVSQNEIRKFENLNAIEDGDKYYVPLNMSPVDAIREPKESVETIKVEDEDENRELRQQLSINRKGYDKAKELINAGDTDVDSEWDFTAEDGNKLLGPDGDNYENFGLYHLAIDNKFNDDTKNHYKFPFGKDGKVYRRALTAIRQRAGQFNYQDIFEAAGKLLEIYDEKEENSKKVNKRKAKKKNGK